MSFVLTYLTPKLLCLCYMLYWDIRKCFLKRQDIEDLDHYEMKEEEPVDGKKSEDDGIEKENLAILEKIRKNQRQDHLNVSLFVEVSDVYIMKNIGWCIHLLKLVSDQL